MFEQVNQLNQLNQVRFDKLGYEGPCTLTAVSVFGGIFDYLIKGLSYQMQTEPKVSKCINKGMCK